MDTFEGFVKNITSFHVFRSRTIFLMIISIAVFVFGMGLMYSAGMPELMIFSPDTGLLMLTVAVFSFGFLFFGYLTPIIMFFIGAHVGLVLKLEVMPSGFVIGAVACSILASYVSIRLGEALLADLRGKGNFRAAWQVSSIVLLVALVLAFSLDFTFAG